mgnify:CR=1 FL=1
MSNKIFSKQKIQIIFLVLIINLSISLENQSKHEDEVLLINKKTELKVGESSNEEEEYVDYVYVRPVEFQMENEIMKNIKNDFIQNRNKIYFIAGVYILLSFLISYISLQYLK